MFGIFQAQDGKNESLTSRPGYGWLRALTHNEIS
ncbi:hypothetical protein EHW99_2061 [Erwinia amylovora]|uniref:Uncharacterized protein n=1 Tax=Erwinia amylovora (strain CFBP1430) TaxID=665029 RepID=D4I146_ERWAC|nr:hypothetical protein EaACW_1528 [Erwinia amylovora ACW56400]QJQ54763.1 hypothetical protein EHX00_2061 [Erwinia amylovora]CBA20471.1 hypothetical protein predicted by Glimmer/Critica [Erwinia amylovora CFBP1430]QJQ58462.1 hypothetical protein EHW99_2061 [Erwinia amylovora]QJQ62161.1 hypothetical protein EHW98_2061 [Erwinia amylovora]